MLRNVTENKSSESRALQSVLAKEAVHFKLRSRDTDKKDTDGDNACTAPSWNPTVRQLSPPELTLNSQLSSSKSEDMESKNASRRDSNSNSTDASDEDSLIVCPSDPETSSLEEEDQYESASEDMGILGELTITPFHDNECSKMDISRNSTLQDQSDSTDNLQRIVYPVERRDAAEQEEQRLREGAYPIILSDDKENQMKPFVYPVQRWDGAEQQKIQQEDKIEIVSVEEENHFEPIVYPSPRLHSVKQEEPRGKETGKIGTFSDVKRSCLSPKSRPTSKLQRSQSLRAAPHTGLPLMYSFRERMGLSPSHHQKAERKPCYNTLCENEDLVYKPSTMDTDINHEERSYRDTIDFEANQQSKLDWKANKNVDRCEPFEIYQPAEETEYGYLQRTKTIPGNLNSITEECSTKKKQTKFPEAQNQACGTGEERNVYSQTRPAGIPSDSTYRSSADQYASYPLRETGLSSYPYVCEQGNENAFPHAFAKTRQKLTKSKPTKAHSVKQEKSTTSTKPGVVTTSTPDQPYSTLNQATSPYSTLNPATSPYSTRNQATSPYSTRSQATSPYSTLRQEMVSPSGMHFPGQVMSQPKGLQRTFSMREKGTSRAPDRFALRVTKDDTVSDPLASSGRQSIKSIMKKSATKKTASPFCLDSDVQTASRNSRYIERGVSVAQQTFARRTNRSQETKMEVPANNIGVWEFGKDNFLTSVPKVWTVADCIAHVRNKMGRYGSGDLDLWVKNRCIMLDKTKSLSDYPGLKSLHVVRRPTSRNPHPSYQTARIDDVDPLSDDTCVGMCCGHATSPDNLYNYAWQKIQNGATEVTCPAVPNVNKPAEQCSKVWEFKSISLLACLSDDENYLFCDKLFLNWLEKEADVYLCPVCNEAINSSCTKVFKCFNCERSGKSHSFCVKCHRVAYSNSCSNNECQESLPKVRALLRDCRMRTLIGVPNCPSVRACPMCQWVIEFDEEDLCKHMTCPRNTCQTKFCFICLKVKTDKYYYPCGGAFEPCQPVPRQLF